MAKRRLQSSRLRELALLLRRGYLAQRELWYAMRGRQALSPKPQADAVWEKAAKSMIEHRVRDYMAFLHLQFERLGKGACCPPVRQCFGPSAFASWAAAASSRQRRRDDVYRDFQFQLQHMRMCLQMRAAVGRWRTGELDRAILLDNCNQLTPLFRYCAAVRTGNGDVACDYADSALMEYLVDRELYDEIWGRFIPEPLFRKGQQYLIGDHLIEETSYGKAT